VVPIDQREFVLADIPGLIEGAHEGVGLGDRFLGHVERCGVLLHLVDGTEEDVAGAYRTIRQELREYGAGLIDKTEIIGLNKADALSDEEISEKKSILAKLTDGQVFVLSGVSGKGVKQVVRALADLVARRRADSARKSENDSQVIMPTDAWSPLGDSK
jgi:GTP-binding protein